MELIKNKYVTEQGFTEPFLACAVTLTVGLLSLAGVATTDSGGRERPTCRGRLWCQPVLPQSQLEQQY